jgi:uncharacterized protein with HEPN domain
MSQPDDSLRLKHMCDYAAEAVQLSQGRTRTDLDTDRLYGLAMIRLVELIGEAASRVSIAGQAQHPQIPWRPMIGARNRLIHGYDQISHDIVWTILTQDLPPLVAQIDHILANP